KLIAAGCVIKDAVDGGYLDGVILRIVVGSRRAESKRAVGRTVASPEFGAAAVVGDEEQEVIDDLGQSDAVSVRVADDFDQMRRRNAVGFPKLCTVDAVICRKEQLISRHGQIAYPGVSARVQLRRHRRS